MMQLKERVAKEMENGTYRTYLKDRIVVVIKNKREQLIEKQK